MKLDCFPLASKSLGNSRKIRVLYPEDSSKKYPVLYVHDGEYCFRLDTPGSSESMELDKALGSHEMVIVSLAAQEWRTRTREYSPFPWVGEARKYLRPGEEEGVTYLEWLICEVMPYIEAHYPVKKGRENAFMLGCSLGAVLSIYASAKYPTIFSRFGSCSLASWGNEKALLSALEQAEVPAETRFFIRVGSEEGIPRDLASLGCCYPRLSEELVSMLQKKGLKKVDYRLNEGRQHKTAEWAKDMPDFIDFLFKQ